MRMTRDAQAIQHDINTQPELAKLYQSKRELAEYWRTHFSDSPDLIGGWGHHLVCPTCTERLIYDRESPDKHVCSGCGQVHDSPEIREAWNASRRHDILAGLNAAALVYHVEGGQLWQDFVLDTLTWYADHYDQFEEHGTRVGQARLGGHTLDEAIMGIQALKALMLAGVDPMDARAQHIKRWLFVPMTHLIMSQPTNLMNISLWHVAFATGVGVYYRDVGLLYPMWKPHRVGASDPFDFSRLTEMNGARLLLENITPDGLWRENSISYHYYALSAAMEFYAFLKEADFVEDGTWDVRILPMLKDPQIRHAMAQAFLSPLKLLYPNGDMPATSDGWKHSLADVAGMYIRAHFLLDDIPANEREKLAAVVHCAGTPEASLDALLYGIPENPGIDLFTQQSVHLTHNKMAMLRDGDTHVFFKYGNLCAGHSHPDALELSIFPVSVDPGSMSYGVPIHGEYFYVGGSHSTFMIDGKSQYNGACGTATMDADGLGITASIDNAVPGVIAQRAVRIDGPNIIDTMDITCDRDCQMDWLFHGSGDFAAEGTWQDTSLPEDTHGFKHFTQVKKLEDGQALSVSWTYMGYHLSLHIQPVDGATFYVARTPDNPTTQSRRAIVVRKQGTALTVPARFVLTKL
ncbi:MAG: heparinase II/III domain-containing protein [Christensenellales bacterium]|jgi:hypothetical protein